MQWRQNERTHPRLPPRKRAPRKLASCTRLTVSAPPVYGQGRAASSLANSCGAVSPSRSPPARSEEHTSELQSPCNLVCRLLLEKKKKKQILLNYYTNKRKK